MSREPLASGRMQKPLIGITPAFHPEEGTVSLRCAYSEAILRADGIPVILPYLERESEIAQVAERLNGVLFTGGGDIDPVFYGRFSAAGGEIPETRRDRMELSLYRRCEKRRIPMLGICRGAQLLAVAAGASLCPHRDGHSGGCLHTVRLPKDTWLSRALGKERHSVNSFHHQTVAHLPKGGTLLAEAEDGVIEAFSLPGHAFCVGVQWHPERMPEDLAAKWLFSAFVHEAKVPVQKQEAVSETHLKNGNFF